MTAETSNLILAVVAVLGVLLAIVSAVGNLIAFVYARMELHAQRKETRELQKLTSDLQQQLHRLNIELDQEIRRLYRVRDALINSQKALSGLYSWIGLMKSKEIIVTPEKMVTAYAEIMASVAELKGLAYAIGDQKLLDLIDQTHPSVDIHDLDSLYAVDLEIGKQAIEIHTRISELIAEATREAK